MDLYTLLYLKWITRFQWEPFILIFGMRWETYPASIQCMGKSNSCPDIPDHKGFCQNCLDCLINSGVCLTKKMKRSWVVCVNNNFLFRQYLRGFPHHSVGKESTCNAGDPSSIPGSGRSTGGGMGYTLWYSWASLVAQLVKNLPAMQQTWVRKISELGRSPGEGKGYPLQYSGLENSMDCIVRGVTELDTTEQLSLSLVGMWKCFEPSVF